MAWAETHRLRLRRVNAQPGEVEEFVIDSHCVACAMEIAGSEAGPEGEDAWFDEDTMDVEDEGPVAKPMPEKILVSRTVKRA